MTRKKNFMVFFEKESDTMVLVNVEFENNAKVLGTYRAKHIYINCPTWSEFFDDGHPRVAMCGLAQEFEMEKNNITVK